MRGSLTEFGSGWKGIIKSNVVTDVSKKIGDAVLGVKKAPAHSKEYVKFARTIGSDDYLHEEGLNHAGIAWQMRQSMTDFGSGAGSRIARMMKETLFPNSMKSVKNSFLKSFFSKSRTKQAKQNLSKLDKLIF